MCPEWEASFKAFFAEVGPRPEGTVLDRINNDAGYWPGNVRWVTHSESMRNTSRGIMKRWRELHTPARKPIFRPRAHVVALLNAYGYSL